MLRINRFVVRVVLLWSGVGELFLRLCDEDGVVVAECQVIERLH